MKSALAKGTVTLMISEGAFILSNYGIHIFLARYLGVETYGLFGILMSLYLINRAFLNTGLPKAVSKFLAESLQTASIMKAGLRLQWILALVFAMGYLLLAPVLAELLGDLTLKPYLMILGVIVVPLALQSLYTSGFLNGLRLFREQAMIKTLFPICRVVLTVILVLLGFGISGALWALFLASFIGIIGVKKMLPKMERTELEVKGREPFPYRKLIFFALPLSVTALGLAMMRNINVLFLKGLLHDNSAVAFYTAALTLSNLPYLVFTAIPLALFPAISKAAASQNRELLRKYLRQALRYTLLLLLPISALMGASSADLLKLFYSSQYLGASSTLSILVWGGTALSLFTILTAVLSASGKPYSEMKLTILFLTAMGFMNLLLIPRYGIEGAAWSALFTAFLGLIIAIILVQRQFGSFLSWRSLLNISIASLTIFVLVSLHLFSGIWLLVGYGLFSVVYIMVLVALGEICYGDWQILHNIFKRWPKE